MTKLNPDNSGFLWPDLTDKEEDLADKAAEQALSHDDSTIKDVSARIADAATRAAALAFHAGRQAAQTVRPVPQPVDIDVQLSPHDEKKIAAAYESAMDEGEDEVGKAYQAVEAAILAYARIHSANPRAVEIAAMWDKYREQQEAAAAETGMTWQAIMEEHCYYQNIVDPAKRCLDMAFGDFEEAWRQASIDVGYGVYQVGRIAGYRMGFQLCDRMKGGAGFVSLPGVQAEDVPVLVATSMLDDYRAKSLLNTLVDFFGLALREGGAR